jgi:hypothetical protein
VPIVVLVAISAASGRHNFLSVLAVARHTVFALNLQDRRRAGAPTLHLVLDPDHPPHIPVREPLAAGFSPIPKFIKRPLGIQASIGRYFPSRAGKLEIVRDLVEGFIFLAL